MQLHFNDDGRILLHKPAILERCHTPLATPRDAVAFLKSYITWNNKATLCCHLRGEIHHKVTGLPYMRSALRVCARAIPFRSLRPLVRGCAVTGLHKQADGCKAGREFPLLKEPLGILCQVLW